MAGDRETYWLGLWNESRGDHPQRPDGSPSLIPPQWWVDRWNMNGLAGAPYATALDPLVMFAWHLATRPAQEPFRLILGGS